MVLEFREGIGEAALKSAWDQTVQATEVLRMTPLRDQSGEVVGLSPASGNVPWKVVKEGVFTTWLAADRLEAFTGWQPWRVAWWPELRRWVWTVHHGLVDGRSMARILRSFLDRVRGGAGEPLPLAVWEEAGEEMREAAREWVNAVRPRLESAVLPEFAGGPRGEVRRYLGPSVLAALCRAARTAGVTPAVIVTWAWGQTLLRATGSKDILMGQVRAGAPVTGAGFTMNTLPLLIGCTGTPQEEWTALSRDILSCRARERTGPEDWPEAARWAAVLMVEKGDWAWQLGAPDLLQGVELHERSSAPLTAAAWLEPQLELSVEAGEEFGVQAAGTLLEMWASLLQAVAMGRPRPVITCPWEYGGDPLPGPAVLTEAWAEARRKFATRTAVWNPGESWTYDTLGEHIERLAGGLAAAGVKPGQNVAVRARRRRLWPLALLAVASISAVFVPVVRGMPAARTRAVMRHSSPALLLCESGGPDESTEGLPTIGFDQALEKLSASANPAVPGSGAPLALLYTSGSTGVPKGVLLGQAGVLNEVRWVAQALGLQPGDRVLQFASPGFDAALEEMLACLLSGATLVPRPEEVAGDFAAFQCFVAEAGITVLDLPTAFWSAWSRWLAESGLQVPAGVRATIIGGERATARALADWRAAGGRILWNTYGPTEASIVATAMEIGVGWNEKGEPPIGRPLPGYKVRVADEQGMPLLPGAAGELWIGGIGVGPGYWRPEAGSMAAFVVRDGERWYRTGDRCRWDGSGNLHFLGRLDHQLKIRGQRVEPSEVESALERYPGVAAAHVGSIAGPQGGEGAPALAAWVRWELDPPENWPQQLRAALAEELPAAAVPVYWAAVTEFPLTERGKLDRAALPVPQMIASSGSEPQTPTEKTLAALWCEVLGLAQVGRGDDFFALGGHSLAALRLFDRIARVTGVRLPLADLMQAPTLGALAAVLDATLTCGASRRPDLPAAMTLHADAAGPPLFCIHGGDGGVFFYRQLAAHLAQPRPLVTLESPALSAARRLPPCTVEAAAARYLEVVRQYQPRGPYYLAGYSFGGVLAFEMARQARMAGEEVAFLALLDTENPAGRWRLRGLLERIAVRWQSTAGSSYPVRVWCLVRRAAEAAVAKVRWLGELASQALKWNSRPHSRLRAMQVRAAHWAAMEAYSPPPVDVPVLLCRTQAIDDKFDVPPDYGWSGVTPALTIRDVPGEHLTIFSPPHAPALARVIEAHLETAKAPGNV